MIENNDRDDGRWQKGSILIHATHDDDEEDEKEEEEEEEDMI